MDPKDSHKTAFSTPFRHYEFDRLPFKFKNAKKIGQDKPIAYTSRTVSDSMVVWFQNSRDPCSRVTKWRFKQVEYDFDVVYKAGKTNVNADELSRNPVKNIKENENKTNTSESKNNDDSKYFSNFIKENDTEGNFAMKTKSTKSIKCTKSTNPTKYTKSINSTKYTNLFYLIQTYINNKNSDGEPEPPVATNFSKFEKKQPSIQNSSSDDETENSVISYILSELKQKQNTKIDSKINAILT